MGNLQRNRKVADADDSRISLDHPMRSGISQLALSYIGATIRQKVFCRMKLKNKIVSDLYHKHSKTGADQKQRHNAHTTRVQQQYLNRMLAIPKPCDTNTRTV